MLARVGMRTRSRRLLWTLLALVLLALAGRVALTPLFRHYTQKRLGRIPGFKGRFDDVSVSLRHFGYSIHGLEIFEAGADDTSEPVLYARRVETRLSLRDLLRFRLAGSTEARHAIARLRFDGSLETLADLLHGVIPVQVRRIDIKDSELQHGPINLTQIDATLHDLEGASPRSVSLRSRFQKSGNLTVFATASDGKANVYHGDFTAHRNVDSPTALIALLRTALTAP
jgi:hypothetical protein